MRRVGGGGSRRKVGSRGPSTVLPRFRGRYPLRRRYLPRFPRIIVEGVSIILQIPKFPIPLHSLNRRYILHVPLSVLAQAPASYEASAHRQPKKHTSPDGGIGRRAGLKHQWSNPCRFDPGSGYTQMAYRYL